MRAPRRATPANSPASTVAKIVQLDTKDGTKFFLDDGSWLLLRLSGTEPLVRVYTETRPRRRSRRCSTTGEKLVKGA